MFLFCLFIMQPWFYPVVKYCFNAICFTRSIFVNSVIVSSIISCNDLYQDFIIMSVWYFVSRNSISVLGAIWPSLSPCTVINPILLTYLSKLGWKLIHFSKMDPCRVPDKFHGPSCRCFVATIYISLINSTKSKDGILILTVILITGMADINFRKRIYSNNSNIS